MSAREALLKLSKADSNDLHIKEFLLYLQSDRGCRPNTIIAYRADLAEFRNYHLNKDLLTLKETDVRRYKFSLVDRGLAPRTINRKLSVIRSFYRYFTNLDDYPEITKNPARNIPATKVPRTTPIILSESQAETLLDGILLTGRCAMRDYAMFSTFLFTGIRVSELVRLRISDLDFEGHLMHVRDGKGGKDRVVPMIDRLEAALKVYLSAGRKYRTQAIKLKTKTKTVEKLDSARSGRDYFKVPGVDHGNTLFLAKHGAGYSERGVDYLFKKYAVELGIYREKLSLHALRRSCLTFLYKQGVDLFILKEISGHARVQTLGACVNNPEKL